MAQQIGPSLPETSAPAVQQIGPSLPQRLQATLGPAIREDSDGQPQLAPIGPTLPERLTVVAHEKRSKKHSLEKQHSSKPAKKRKSTSSVPTGSLVESATPALAGSLGLSGLWLVKVKYPRVDFLYNLEHHLDNSITGYGSVSGRDDTEEKQKLTGQLQGHVFTWSEETGGKFRATISPDGQSFTGNAILNESERVEFEGARAQVQSIFPKQGQEQEHVLVQDLAIGESFRCTRGELASVLPRSMGSAQEVDASDLLKACPLEPSAHHALVPALRALVGGRPADVITVGSAIYTLAVCDWLCCRSSTMEALKAAVRKSADRVPAMLSAVDTSGPCVAHVLRRGLLITDTGAIKALAKDALSAKWRPLCEAAVLSCLRVLTAADPLALRLSPAAAAALNLGVAAREVHAALPACLRLDPGSASLVLDLRKRGIGPEGAARLELPDADAFKDVDVDLARCNIRAVGAASLRFPAGLARLRLSLQKCDIGPEGAKGLVLPSTLTSLELDLAHCLIGPMGAATLQLPPSLVELDLGLLRCAIGDRGAKALALPGGLQRLRLNLARCAIGPDGLRALRLPTRLQSLSLDLTMCQVGADGVKALLASLPATLESLELELTGCGLGTDLRAVEELAARRLPSLKTRRFQAE